MNSSSIVNQLGHAAALLPDHCRRVFPEAGRAWIVILVWAVGGLEESEHCEVAGAALFVAFAEGCANDDDLPQNADRIAAR